MTKTYGKIILKNEWINRIIINIIGRFNLFVIIGIIYVIKIIFLSMIDSNDMFQYNEYDNYHDCSITYRKFNLCCLLFFCACLSTSMSLVSQGLL